MVKNDELDSLEEDSPEMGEVNSVWDILSSGQKKYFKKLSEKTPEKMNYIG